jgi:methionyl-tRNA formyltransferase
VRLVFFGTPAFAIPSLEAVLAASEVAAVVTRPARPRGRGLRVEEPPAAVVAAQYGLEVLQPGSLRTPEFLSTLRALSPDLVVAVAFGRLIPPEVLEIPSLGGINLHPSLLPRYRGAAPIPRAIAAGETETGVTVLHLSEELDAGDIILQRTVPISPDDTSATLEARLAREGADLLVEAIRLLESGRALRRPQDSSQATLAPKLSREEGLIRWTDPAARIANLVRAFVPWPVAYTLRDGEPLRIWRATAHPVMPEARSSGAGAPGRTSAAGERLPPVEERPLPPGTVVRADDAEGAPLVVAAGEGTVHVHEVQPSSGRRMPASAYVRGYRLSPGTVLGR